MLYILFSYYSHILIIVYQINIKNCKVKTKILFVLILYLHICIDNNFIYS